MPTSWVRASCTSSSGHPRARCLRRRGRAGRPDLRARREQKAALEDPQTHAEISNLDRDENTLDRTAGDKLVEVYRPVWTPTGQQMLFEIYAPYDQVSQRTSQLWRGFAGVTLSSLLLFLVLLAPLFWHLLSRVRRHQRQRELLLERSVDASSNERRLIAASLHDGPVQDLAATSFVSPARPRGPRPPGSTGWSTSSRTSPARCAPASGRCARCWSTSTRRAWRQAGLGAALGDLVQSVRRARPRGAPAPRRRGAAGAHARPGAPGLPGRAGDVAQRRQARGAVHGERDPLPGRGRGRAGRARRRQRLRRRRAARPTPRRATSACSCSPTSPRPGAPCSRSPRCPGRGTHWRLRVPRAATTARAAAEESPDA